MKNNNARSRKNKSRKSARTSPNPRNLERLQLYGIHTIAAALENPERKKHRLLVTQNAAKRLEKQIARIGDQYEVYEAKPRDIDALVGHDAVHQGCLLDCDPLTPKQFSDITPGDPLLILDQVSDPHNLGAIIRSCVAMNITNLITTSRNSAPQTAVLAKSASGGLDMINLIEVSNLSKSILALNAQGYQTIGLDSEGPDILEKSIEKTTPYAILLGAEGKGLRQQTRQACSILARLDMPGKIKSLNVSNAAALALYVVNRHTKI